MYNFTIMQGEEYTHVPFFGVRPLNIIASELEKRSEEMDYDEGVSQRSKALWNSKGVKEIKDIWVTSLKDRMVPPLMSFTL